MKCLSRYLFKECTHSTLLAVGVLTFVILLPQVLNLVDLWVNKGVSVVILGEMTVMLIPKILSITLPIALLIGILMALGRLSQDSELVVMQACGTSLYQIVRPISILVISATLLSLWLTWVATPLSSYQFFRLKNALISTATLAIKPQTFNQTIPNLTIYVQAQDPKGKQLHGLLVHDRRDPKNPITLTAQKGLLHLSSDGETALLLEHGGRHQKFSNGNFQLLNFDSYDLNLGITLGIQFKEGREKLQQLDAEQLTLATHDKNSERSHEARIVWHRRMAIPAATFILGILAIPMGIQQSHRSGRGYGFVIAIFILILHFLLLGLGEAMTYKKTVDPLIGFWSPNLLMTLLTLYIIKVTNQGRTFKIILWLTQILPTLPRRLLRPDASFQKIRP
ncbi:MAG: LPS export ABC transporter permease LptF [Magnetococcus sp. DMHC-6]